MSCRTISGGAIPDLDDRRPGVKRAGLASTVFFLLLLGGAAPACAEPSVEIAGSSGFGAFVAGVTPARFALSPSVSVAVRGERWFAVVRDTTSFLGAGGGRFGINNETTLGGGLFGERVNLSAGLSLVAYSIALCGPERCGQVSGLAPGASLRFDLFGPYLSDGLGIAVDCAGTWITGDASPVWSGISVRCSAGPVLRFTSHP